MAQFNARCQEDGAGEEFAEAVREDWRMRSEKTGNGGEKMRNKQRDHTGRGMTDRQNERSKTEKRDKRKPNKGSRESE